MLLWFGPPEAGLANGRRSIDVWYMSERGSGARTGRKKGAWRGRVSDFFHCRQRNRSPAWGSDSRDVPQPTRGRARTGRCLVPGCQGAACHRTAVPCRLGKDPGCTVTQARNPSRVFLRNKILSLLVGVCLSIGHSPCAEDLSRVPFVGRPGQPAEFLRPHRPPVEQGRQPSWRHRGWELKRQHE